MKKTTIQSLIWIAFYVAFIWACQKENISKNPSHEQAKLAAEDNAQIVAAAKAVMNITAGAMVQKSVMGGRINNGGDPGHDGDGDNEDDDDEIACKPSIKATFSLDTSHADSLMFSGSVTIDFGDGSTCMDSTHMRTGKITDTFNILVTPKDSVTFSSTETITFEAFHLDTVQVDGTIIIKSSSNAPTTVETQNGKITYPDGTFVTWSGTLTFHHEQGEGRHWIGKIIKVTGSLTGINRAGLPFTSTITKDIVFQFGCFNRHRLIPVSGIVAIVVGGGTSTIDFGDGNCRKHWNITCDGETEEHDND